MTTSKIRTPLRPSIYSPTLTFFHLQTEDLDTLAIKTHSVRLARASLVGLVTLGSNGEAVHLSRSVGSPAMSCRSNGFPPPS